MTAEQLSKILESHAKWARGEGGERADLSGAYLSGANLRHADLRSADLSGANLRHADLRSADLSGADLRSANLSGANLRSANLSGADLRSANLSGANLSGADLGVKNPIARMLRVVGACQEASEWVDSQGPDADPTELLDSARDDWREWLTAALGGAPSIDRLRFVAEYVTAGAVGRGF